MTSATTISAVSNLAELRRMTARLIPFLDWRCNGLGVLQGYVAEGKAEETRIHIWHPSLEKPGIEASGKLHDHRFTLRSTVLYGSIDHDEYVLTPKDDGAYQAFPVVHAREAMRENKTFDGSVTAEPQRYEAKIIPFTFHPGDVYAFRKRSFHGTRVRGLVVTLVSKFEQDSTPARILAPAGSEPVHAFANPPSRNRWLKYLDQAVRALGGNTPLAQSVKVEIDSMLAGSTEVDG